MILFGRHHKYVRYLREPGLGVPSALLAVEGALGLQRREGLTASVVGRWSGPDALSFRISLQAETWGTVPYRGDPEAEVTTSVTRSACLLVAEGILGHAPSFTCERNQDTSNTYWTPDHEAREGMQGEATVQMRVHCYPDAGAERGGQS